MFETHSIRSLCASEKSQDSTVVFMQGRESQTTCVQYSPLHSLQPADDYLTSLCVCVFIHNMEQVPHTKCPLSGSHPRSQGDAFQPGLFCELLPYSLIVCLSSLLGCPTGTPPKMNSPASNQVVHF